jgi:hypothetical protein
VRAAVIPETKQLTLEDRLRAQHDGRSIRRAPEPLKDFFAERPA